jgi:hypothetical protein
MSYLDQKKRKKKPFFPRCEFIMATTPRPRLSAEFDGEADSAVIFAFFSLRHPRANSAPWSLKIIAWCLRIRQLQVAAISLRKAGFFFFFFFLRFLLLSTGSEFDCTQRVSAPVLS